MFLETLPADCPPLEAAESDKWLYRIIKGDQIQETDFWSFNKLNSQRQEYKELCKAWGLSLFEAKDSAIEIIKRKPDVGISVVEIFVTKSLGKLQLTNPKSTHHTLWLYDTFSLDQLQYRNIEKVQ